MKGIFILSKYQESTIGNLDITKEQKIGIHTIFFDNTVRIWRLRSRFQHAPIAETAKFPIFLPKPVTKEHREFILNWIMFMHHILHHAQTTWLAYAIMQYAYIPQIKKLVTSALRRCVPCIRVNPKSHLSEQIMGSLPIERILLDAAKQRSFAHCGADFGGPIRVKIQGTIHKAYFVLFTDMISRAVHCELTLSQNLNDFLLAWRRFVARRGIPAVIYTDQARVFQSSSISLEAWRVIIKNCISSVKSSIIEWKHITVRAPWQGGFYERLVGSIKRNLKSNTAEMVMTDWQLYTYLTKAEAIVNSRPLSAHDLDTPITPSHLLYGRNIALGPPSFEGCDLPKNLQDHADIIKQWRDRTALITHFYRRWRKDYFLSLQQSRKWTDPKPNLKIGQIVIVVDDSLRKGGRKYPLGRVTGIKIGRDDRVRTVTVVLSDKRTFSRPIQLLAPLEVDTIQ